MSADTGAVLIGEGDVIGAYGDEAAVGDFKLAMEFDKAFGLAAIFGAETPSAEDEDHGVRSLEVGELAALCSVIGELIIREEYAGDDV